jgi:hypothetical protein
MFAHSAAGISGVLSNNALWAYRRFRASFHKIRWMQEIGAASRKAFFGTERLNKFTRFLPVAKRSSSKQEVVSFGCLHYSTAHHTQLNIV